MSGEEGAGMGVVADLGAEQGGGKVVVPLVGLEVEREGEREPAQSVLEAQAQEAAALGVSVQAAGRGRYGPV